MVMSQKEIFAYAKLGFIAGIATSFILKFISQLVSMIPGVEMDLQSIAITTTGVGGVIGTGFGQYAQKLFGLVPVSLSGMDWIYTGIGGAAFVVLGVFIAKFLAQQLNLNLLKGNKARQLTTIFVLAGVVSGWILSSTIAIPTISGIIVMVVNAFILARILIWVDAKTKVKLIP